MPVASPHKQAQGKRRKLMEPAPWMQFHPFVATLEQWASGVAAVCGEPWSEAAIRAAVERGPHTSALTPEARVLIDEEMKYQIQAGFSETVLWNAIQHSYPINLKVSPLAVIPQVGRRGRLLLDLSFPSQAARPASKRGRRNWVVPPPLAPSVNSTTIQQSPEYPVKELGRVLPRLLSFMYCVPREETIMFAKIDLSDGFWRMLVRESDKWNFAYVLPGAAGDPLRLIIPHALQMGWTESPAVVRRQSSPVADRPWQMSAVYVDDYILAAVESADGSALQRTGRAALHTIHGLFPPPDRSGHVGGKDPISLKKLEAGDARWAQSKELLGFVFNGQSRTVHLTQRKALGISEAITRLLKKTRAPVPKFQSVVGKMRHVATILPSARSLFTPVNRALRGHPSTISLSASGEVRAALLDLRQLVTTLAARPTHVKEILPAQDPDYIGYCDASAFGAGGVWFSGTSPVPETVWRLQWPLDITAAVVSESNPTGALTNSDLEMAAVVLQLNVLEPLVPSMHHKSMQIHSDNTPSVAWLTKMATKTANSDAAHRLVRGLALRQRMLHSAPVSITHVAGSDNNLADIASRAITQLDDDHAFLTHFDNLFPLQERFWQRASPPPAQLSNVISTLRGQRLTMQRWTVPLEPPAGAGGNNTVPIVERIRGCATQLRDPQPATLGICRPDSYWILWERSAGWSPDRRKSPASRGTSLRAGRIPRPPTSRRRLRPGFTLYPPP
ncbi:adenylate kinase [Fragilaria crotonensis]|nr:adenylate kinase [Fragilaria crotonensis]